MNCDICKSPLDNLLPKYMYYCTRCFHISNTDPLKIHEEYNKLHIDEFCKHILYRLGRINDDLSDIEYTNIRILLITDDTNFISKFKESISEVSDICKDSISFDIEIKSTDEFISAGKISNVDIIIALNLNVSGVLGQNPCSLTNFILKCKETMGSNTEGRQSIFNIITKNSNFINDTNFNFSENNYFNTNSMHRLCILNNLHLNNVEHINIREDKEASDLYRSQSSALQSDYLFEIINNINNKGNALDNILEEMDADFYTVNTYYKYYLNYLIYCCDAIKDNIKDIINDLEKK
jgi:hypothetical protein